MLTKKHDSLELALPDVKIRCEIPTEPELSFALIKRFDRGPHGERIPYLSAITSVRYQPISCDKRRTLKPGLPNQ